VMPDVCLTFAGTSVKTMSFTFCNSCANETRRRTVELVQPSGRVARTDDVKDVIRELQNSPTAAILRALSLHERILLAALLKCVRRTGVSEIPWADVNHQHHLCAGVFADSSSTRCWLHALCCPRCAVHGALCLIWSRPR
jgi:hypothetical protein